jgi:hypothetical protein
MKSAALLSLALCACSSAFAVEGSGVESTQLRKVEPFERVRIEGSADAIVVVGETQQVAVIGDDNLLEHVSTRVTRANGGTLEIGMDSGSYRFKKGLRVEITVPRLTGASIAGSGDLDLLGIDSESFDVSIAGSGDVKGAGRTQRLAVEIAGSGDAALFSLAARSADVDIAGSGAVDVNVSDELDAQIMGSGSVRYRGEPRVSRKIAGSGEVVRAQ